MPLPTDYERDEHREREAAKVERQIDKADHDRDRKKDEVDTKLEGCNLTESDWIQIKQAASGCVGGTSDEWPNLRAAIEKITGRPFGPRKTASWLQGFCEGVLIQAGRTVEAEKDYGTNAGIKCDMGNGPCACGAWH